MDNLINDIKIDFVKDLFLYEDSMLLKHLRHLPGKSDVE
jgi:hypothetical protein